MTDLTELCKALRSEMRGDHEAGLGREAADVIERLTAVLQRIDAINDNPARFDSEINIIVQDALKTHCTDCGVPLPLRYPCNEQSCPQRAALDTQPTGKRDD